jgi:hypothetical protein
MLKPAPGKGMQVMKLSPDGKVLMTLGKAGETGTGLDVFNQPTAVAFAPNGDIFISEGHAPTFGNSRIMKFDKTGKFIKTFGRLGSGNGEFKGPHVLAFDSQGRLFVADRSNSRVDIFSQDGTFIACVEAIRPSQRHLDRQERHPVRVGFRVRRRTGERHAQPWLQTRRSNRQREDWKGRLLHSASAGLRSETTAARRRRRRFARKHLSRSGAGEVRLQIREEGTLIRVRSSARN